MRFRVTRTSDWKAEAKFIELNSLEELIEFARRECPANRGHEVVVSAPEDTTSEPLLEIYDDWRE